MKGSGYTEKVGAKSEGKTAMSGQKRGIFGRKPGKGRGVSPEVVIFIA
jgi:hypothetical protein